MDPNLEDDIRAVLAEVPPPIRTFFGSGKIEMVSRALMQEHRLHVDQGAVVQREIILLLLGLQSPAEFSQALIADANLDQSTVTAISRNVNEQIFMPLREEMRQSFVRAGPPARPTPPPPPPPSYGPPAPPRPVQPPPPPSAQVRPAQPAGQMRTAEGDLAAAIAHAKEHPPTSRPAAPLPPRGALPGAAARAPGQPIFHHPLPARPPQSEAPPNLPTGESQYGGGTSTEDFPSLPPLVKPPSAPLSSVPEDAFPPHTRYPNDPYREPVE